MNIVCGAENYWMLTISSNKSFLLKAKKKSSLPSFRKLLAIRVMPLLNKRVTNKGMSYRCRPPDHKIISMPTVSVVNTAKRFQHCDQHFMPAITTFEATVIDQSF